MTRASTVTRSAASLLTSRLLVAGIALIFLGVSTRLLSLEEMALFAVYNTFCGLLTVVGSLGLLATCIRMLPGLMASGGPERGEAARLIRLSLVVYVVGAGLVVAGLWLAAEPISRILLKTPDRAGDVRAAALAALCFGFYEASQLLLSALQRFGRLGGYNVATAIVQRILSLALFFSFGLKGYLAGFAIGSLAGLGLGLATILPIVRSLHLEDPPVGGRSAGGWLSWSMPFYVDGYLRYFYMHADQLLVGIFLTPADLSVYFVAKRFIQYCQLLVSSLIDPLGAKVAELRGEPGAVGRAYTTSLRYFVLLFVPLSVLLACLSPFLLLVIGGERYTGGVLPLSLLFLSLPFFAIFAHMAVFVFALGRPRERLETNLAAMLAQAAAILALMPWLALPGLALARAFGFGAGALFAHRRARIDGARALARALAQCAPPTMVMAVLIMGPHTLVGRPGLLPLYAVPAVGACLLGYLAFVLTPDDRAALGSMLPFAKK